MQKLAILTVCGVAWASANAIAEECNPGLALPPVVQGQLPDLRDEAVAEDSVRRHGTDAAAIRRALSGPIASLPLDIPVAGGTLSLIPGGLDAASTAAGVVRGLIAQSDDLSAIPSAAGSGLRASSENALALPEAARAIAVPDILALTYQAQSRRGLEPAGDLDSAVPMIDMRRGFQGWDDLSYSTAAGEIRGFASSRDDSASFAVELGATVRVRPGGDLAEGIESVQTQRGLRIADELSSALSTSDVVHALTSPGDVSAFVTPTLGQALLPPRELSAALPAASEPPGGVALARSFSSVSDIGNIRPLTASSELSSIATTDLAGVRGIVTASELASISLPSRLTSDSTPSDNLASSLLAGATRGISAGDLGSAATVADAMRGFARSEEALAALSATEGLVKIELSPAVPSSALVAGRSSPAIGELTVEPLPDSSRLESRARESNGLDIGKVEGGAQSFDPPPNLPPAIVRGLRGDLAFVPPQGPLPGLAPSDDALLPLSSGAVQFLDLPDEP
jgi:hypothetical protein